MSSLIEEHGGSQHGQSPHARLSHVQQRLVEISGTSHFNELKLHPQRSGRVRVPAYRERPDQSIVNIGISAT